MDIDEFGKVSLVNQSQSLKQLEIFCVIRAGQIAMANDSDEENYRLLLRGFTVCWHATSGWHFMDRTVDYKCYK